MLSESKEPGSAYSDEVMSGFAGGDPLGSEVPPVSKASFIETEDVDPSGVQENSTGDPNGSMVREFSGQYAMEETPYPIQVSLDNAAGDPTGM